MRKNDLEKHVTGESLFADDINTPEGTLYAVVFDSPIAHARIVNLDINPAMISRGVAAVLTADDIPGVNQVGGIIPDESLFAEKETHFIGEPIALVIADTYLNAAIAAKKIEAGFEKLEIITDPREAFIKGKLIMPPRTFSRGSTDAAWRECRYIFEGKVDSGGQEHLYLETQGAIAIPGEGGRIRLISSTQSPTSVQKTIARVLDVPMNFVEVDVLRLGGGFGGKEDQATHWAVMAALAAYKLKKPVKLILSRIDDLRMTGKRHPYSSDFKIGLDDNLMIIAYEAVYYQNAGAVADLSPAILDRTLFHATNSYFIPNVKATGISCRTNLPPNTAFRGFGGPQGKFVIEAAIYKAAEELGIEPSVIQRKNLLKEGDIFHYGQAAKNCQAINCWNDAEQKFNYNELKAEAAEFNRNSTLIKKGISVMPICFGISFTNTFLNQAGALVHVYMDGSVGVSTAAVEMGQGVNEKIKTVVSQTFSINRDKVRVESTNTTRIANTSATAASSGADLNGNAAIIAAQNIRQRLLDFASGLPGYSSAVKPEIRDGEVFLGDEKTGLLWEDLILKAYQSRISLSSHALYATPGLHFDKETNTGNPFAYHVYGAAITTVSLDCLRGIYSIDSVRIVHDSGKSLDELIDRGQIEGALTQGIGWLTLEEVVHSPEGRLLSNSLSTYKVPDIYSAPKEIQVIFLEGSENDFGPLRSKAVGEPPLMYGIGAYFAIMNAMKAFRPGKVFGIDAPLTPEKVLTALYDKI